MTALTTSYFQAPRYPPTAAPGDVGRGLTPVMVVGAGPVGLTFALLLARSGVSCVVLESSDSVSLGSRAICLSRRSLEILDWCGVVDTVLETAVPWARGRSFHRDQEVLNFAMPWRPQDRFPPMVNLQQCVLEQMLVDQALAEPLISLRWCSTVTGLAQSDDSVLVDIDSPLGAYTDAALWVVACDGARSPVREMLGLAMEGSSYEGRFVIVDLHMPTDRPAERLCWFEPPTFPGKTVLLHKQPFDIWRFDYQIGGEENPNEALDPQVVLPRVKRHLDWIGESTPWTVEWISTYRAHSLTLPAFKKGRVIFGGDSAHVIPIFGVRGLNSGLVDAANLAWKMGHALAGAPTSLLDSYSPEQRYAAVENLRAADASTRVMAPATAGQRALRNAALAVGRQTPALAGLLDPRQTRPIDYLASPLNVADRPEDSWAGGPSPGCLAPDVAVGARHLSELPFSFSLVGVGLDAEALRSSTGLNVISLDTEDARAEFDASPGAVYLLRPDRHVLARWRSATSSDIIRVLADVAGNREYVRA